VSELQQRKIRSTKSHTVHIHAISGDINLSDHRQGRSSSEREGKVRAIPRTAILNLSSILRRKNLPRVLL
jgi:hypothetical protein